MIFYRRMFYFLTDKTKHTSVAVIAEVFHLNAKQKGTNKSVFLNDWDTEF